MSKEVEKRDVRLLKAEARKLAKERNLRVPTYEEFDDARLSIGFYPVSSIGTEATEHIAFMYALDAEIDIRDPVKFNRRRMNSTLEYAETLYEKLKGTPFESEATEVLKSMRAKKVAMGRKASEGRYPAGYKKLLPEKKMKVV